ncbi:MAG: hypothetical protein WDA10_12060 [Porticoccaceae bacterium]|jgi:hypothetical protein|nr:hypothetical protein [Porticoccaceae bacterium]MEA3300121.1 dihydrodipicolinate reductase [Pseudomonadota bacterium]HLS99371.1 hypothetical protein [Porticoccaceae bacterium]
MTYKVIQWATGHTGKMVARALAERAAYEIVGAFVYSPDKAGKDLGEICGIGKLGVTASNDREAILALDADCVMFLAGAENDVPGALDDVCALLASGKDVITTAAQFVYPKSLGPAIEGRIRDACAIGGSTYHGLGVMPGFIAENVALTLTRMSRRIDLLNCYETLLYNEYPSTFQMFDLMGFGYAPDDPTPMFSNLEVVAQVWQHSCLLVAEAVNLPIDRIESFRHVEVAQRDLQVAAGFIPKGTVGAINFGSRVISGGEVRIVMQHYTRMDDDLAPHWPRGDGWTIEIEGEPSVRAKIDVGIHGEVHTDQGCLATAMHAIHAVPYVVSAAPGILSLADVPPAWGGDAFHIKP